MSTQELSDLCGVILQDTYGELAATILEILFAHGRLSASQISKHVKLPVAAVQRTLVALLQNRFVLFWQDQGGPASFSSSKAIYYYANWKQVYSILWTGQIITIVNELFPRKADMAAEIVKNMHIYGHMKVEDYLDAHSSDDSKEIASVMTSLVQRKILTPLYDFEFHPMEDVFGQLYQKHYKLISADRGGPQSEVAKKGAANTAAETDKSALLSRKDGPNIGLIKVENNSTTGASRAARKATRRNVITTDSAGSSSSNDNEKWTVDKDVVLCVNHDKYLILARNSQLVKLASMRIGRVTSEIYKRLLECYESKLSRCKQQTSAGVEFNISTMEIARNLDATKLDIHGSIIGSGPMSSSLNNKRKTVKQEPGLEIQPRKRAKLNNQVNFTHDDEDDGDDDILLDDGDDLLDNDDAYDDSFDDDKNTNNHNHSNSNGNGKANSIDAVNRHLELLADSPIRFVRKVGNRGGGEWYVPFDEVVEDLKKVTYEDVISRKYGPIATRVLRVIRDKGKVDEKLLSQITLLPAKDIRSHLTDLQNIGCLDLQEVPRSNDRAPGRNFYLWFHKSSRAYSLIVQDMYKTMNRIYTRLGAERKNCSILLAKLDREDVKGNEDTYLSLQEKRELAELRRTEEKLLVQLFRIEGLVRIFREY